MARLERTPLVGRNAVAALDIRRSFCSLLSSDSGSLLQSAQNQNVRQSWLCGQIVGFENSLGAQFFERTSNDAVTTAYGEVFEVIARPPNAGIDTHHIAVWTTSVGVRLSQLVAPTDLRHQSEGWPSNSGKSAASLRIFF
jgi:hypothetical protein